MLSALCLLVFLPAAGYYCWQGLVHVDILLQIYSIAGTFEKVVYCLLQHPTNHTSCGLVGCVGVARPIHVFQNNVQWPKPPKAQAAAVPGSPACMGAEAAGACAQKINYVLEYLLYPVHTSTPVSVSSLKSLSPLSLDEREYSYC